MWFMFRFNIKFMNIHSRFLYCYTWEIFSQEDIKLQPKEVKQLTLGVGFMMSEGIVLTGLANSLREKRCSIQNEVNLENTNDIITTISNNSKEIQENELLYLVCYKKL